MTRPDLKLVHDRDGLPVECLAAEYWRAASSLRGPGDELVSPDAASRCLHDLSRTCPHDRLRRAADGTLTSLGLRDHGSPDGSPGPEAA